jgi:ATP-dependent Clp protease ATP-binding subunit ClpB
LTNRLEDRDIHVVYDESVQDWIAEVGFEPQFGARPLKRAVKKMIAQPLAEHLLKSAFKPGDTVKIISENRQIRFLKADLKEVEKID